MTSDLKLFVAYAHEDRDTVRALVDTLKKRNWKVYWDEELPAGQHGWRAILESELNGAFGVMVAWSKHSVRSDAVIKEARAARAMKALYGVSIDGSDIPSEFADGWSVDLRGWTGDSDDPRIDKILAWPDVLAKFKTGLGYPVSPPELATFKKWSPGGTEA
jgi:hypothetical protein